MIQILSNTEKANQCILEDTNQHTGYFHHIATPNIVNGIPELVCHFGNQKSEYFIYKIKEKKKFFLKVFINETSIGTTTHPRFELSSWYDNLVNSYLNKYKPYKPIQESLTLFILNDLPKLVNHQRDKNIYIQCFTDEGQGNIGHITLDPKLCNLIYKNGITINYVVQIE